MERAPRGTTEPATNRTTEPMSTAPRTQDEQARNAARGNTAASVPNKARITQNMNRLASVKGNGARRDEARDSEHAEMPIGRNFQGEQKRGDAVYVGRDQAYREGHGRRVGQEDDARAQLEAAQD